jgi:hypothetical protein
VLMCDFAHPRQILKELARLPWGPLPLNGDLLSGRERTQESGKMNVATAISGLRGLGLV